MDLAPPKPVAEVLSDLDRFRCDAYKATITARTCLSRQAMLDTPKAERSGDYLYCDGCGDGRLIRLRVKDRGPAASPVKANHNFISGAVTRRSRQPRAPDPAPPKPGPTLLPVAVLPRRPPAPPPPVLSLPALIERPDLAVARTPAAEIDPPSVLPAALPRLPASSALDLTEIADALEGMEARAVALVLHIRSTRATLAAKR